MQKKCKGCSEEFKTSSTRALYCTSKCRHRTNAKKRFQLDASKTPNSRTTGFKKIIRKPNKKGEYISESTKSYYDYWQG